MSIPKVINLFQILIMYVIRIVIFFFEILKSQNLINTRKI